MATTTKASSLKEVVNIIRDKLPELRKRYGVKKIAVFGSFARGEQREDSDVDILVELELSRSGFDLVGLAQELSELLGRKVDIATLPALKPRIAPQILKEAVIVRDPRMYVEDAYEAVEKILEYTEGMSFEEFLEDDKTRDAVERRFQILGEAVKNIPGDVKKKFPEVPWKKIAGFRDVIVHEYFGMDYARMWGIIKKELPELKQVLRSVLGFLNKSKGKGKGKSPGNFRR